MSVAIVLEDKDAYPVTGGFAWIHWLAANITRFEIKENDKGHGIENHAFFFGIFSYLLIEFYHNILRHL